MAVSTKYFLSPGVNYPVKFIFMELKKITPETLRKARKAGFKTKAPKKPARSAKNGTLERYVERYNDWVNRANAAAQAHDKAEKLKRKIFGM